MKSIQLHIPALLQKIQEMSDDHMEYVTLTMRDEVIDQNILYPAFLHFEASTEDAFIVDYESLEALNLYTKDLGQSAVV